MNKLLLYFAGAVLLTSCEKILEQEPQAALDAASAFNTRQAVEAGIIGTYDALQSASYYGVDFSLLAELGSDNIDHTGSFPSYLEFKNRNITTANANISGMWNQMYVVINRANTVLKSAEAINDPAFAKNSAIAELRFLRAFVYFDLLRGWGGSPDGYNKPNGKGVPLFLAPTLTASDAAAKPRATEAETFTQILSDLDFAIANLPATAPSGRVDKNAALGIKARVQLYREDFASAETLASQIISQFSTQARGGLAAEYAGLFANKNTKPESLWELQFTATDANSLRFYYYGRSEVSSNAAFGAAHEAGDLRKPVNYTPSGTRFRQLKFFRADGTDNIILLRLAEIYLIRAEARARKASPDLAGSRNDLNLVRSRAGLLISAALTPAALLDEILKERRIELAHEGHRWFDLRRTNRIVSTLGVPQVDAFRALWPIPQRERETSGFTIEQNTGY